MAKKQVWLRYAGTVQTGGSPKGFKYEVGLLLQAFEHSEEWSSWWAGTGFDYFLLWRGFYGSDDNGFFALPKTLQRRGDHVEGALRVYFPADYTRWAADESKAQARATVLEFFESVGRRLKAGSPPALPPGVAPE